MRKGYFMEELKNTDKKGISTKRNIGKPPMRLLSSPMKMQLKQCKTSYPNTNLIAEKLIYRDRFTLYSNLYKNTHVDIDLR